MSRVLAFSCLHTPFDHKDAIDFLNDTRKKYKCDKIVCLGDEIDFHVLSDYQYEPDAMGAKEEYCKAMGRLSKYQTVFPKMEICTSNHTSRVYRAAAKAHIPMDFLKSYKEFMLAPKGWNWHDEVIIDNVIYIHGDGYSKVEQAVLSKFQSVVMGHLHTKGEVEYIATPNQLVFGMNVGCLYDRHQYAFRYASKHKRKPILGAGVVIDGKYAVFEPMIIPDKIRRIK